MLRNTKERAEIRVIGIPDIHSCESSVLLFLIILSILRI